MQTNHYLRKTIELKKEEGEKEFSEIGGYTIIKT